MEPKNAPFLLKLYLKSAGYSFSHMGRLFLRLFLGLMLSQFGIRQLAGQESETLLAIPYLAEGLSLWLIVTVEIICSFCIMIGFLTRIVVLPPFALMIVSSVGIYSSTAGLMQIQLACVPFLFMGMLMFLMLTGPGKISIDYYLSLYLINRNKGAREEDLEEV